MIKKQTGRKFTPDDFRKLNQCVQCGKASEIKKGELCPDCTALDLGKCEICEMVLRTGLQTYYTYDIQDDHRDTGVEFKANKASVKEFVYQEMPYHPKYSDNLCSGCVDWDKRMKDICWNCDNDFTNTKENYKTNGNMCELCSAQFIEPNDEETSDN